MNDMIDSDHNGSVIASVPNDLILDHAKYADELFDCEIPAEKMREVLEALWGIVECGFSIDVSGRATIEIFNQAARGDLKDEV